MRQVFSSGRLENFEGVAQMLGERPDRIEHRPADDAHQTLSPSPTTESFTSPETVTRISSGSDGSAIANGISASQRVCE